MSRKSRYSWQAGSLYFAITLAILFSLISASFIAYARLLRLEEDKSVLLRSLNWNQQHVLEWMLSETPPAELGSRQRISSLTESNDSIEVWRSLWGLFELAGIRSYNPADTLQQTMLLGKTISDKDRKALVLADRNRPLSLCGKTILEGPCTIPKAGVKRAYIEGKTFKGEHLVNGTILNASKSIPTIWELLGVDSNLYDALQRMPVNCKTDHSLNTPFDKAIAVMHLDSGYYEDQEWTGHVLVVSDGPVYLDSSVHVEDVIVCAPIIRLASGFSGSAQFIASDSIVLEEDVRLRYPSALFLGKQDPGGAAFIQIDSLSIVNGVVALNDPFNVNTSKSSIHTSATSRIEGLLYSNKGIDLKGDVYGSVYVDRLTLSTPSSLYENHLLDVCISSTRLDEAFVFPMGMSGNRNIMKWL